MFNIKMLHSCTIPLNENVCLTHFPRNLSGPLKCEWGFIYRQCSNILVFILFVFVQPMTRNWMNEPNWVLQPNVPSSGWASAVFPTDACYFQLGKHTATVFICPLIPVHFNNEKQIVLIWSEHRHSSGMSVVMERICEIHFSYPSVVVASGQLSCYVYFQTALIKIFFLTVVLLLLIYLFFSLFLILLCSMLV